MVVFPVIDELYFQVGVTSVLGLTGEKVCDHCAINLKFSEWDHYIPCAFDKILATELSRPTESRVSNNNAALLTVCFSFFTVTRFQSIWQSLKNKNSETRCTVIQKIQDFTRLKQVKRQRNWVDEQEMYQKKNQRKSSQKKELIDT